MAATSKNDPDTKRRISEAINDTKCLDLNVRDSENVLKLIDEYFGDGVDSDDEDLSPEERDDYRECDGDYAMYNVDDNEEDKALDLDMDVIEAMDMDSDEDENFLVVEPGNDVILANGDPEFMSEDDEKVCLFIYEFLYKSKS